MFVVVVGGAAGCVVAARLAGSTSCSVLLLEAGPDRRADMPPELRNGWTIEPEPFDWGYESEPHAGSVRPARRKKLLGGTSWLTRFTPRGSPADYDGWEALGVNTADAYLPSGRTPPNLTIRGDSAVGSVAFEGPRAVGVRLLDGTVIEAGWVVLCAGT